PPPPPPPPPLFFFYDTANTLIYTALNIFSLHDALPFYIGDGRYERKKPCSGLFLCLKFISIFNAYRKTAAQILMRIIFKNVLT
ncbi:hypothetical protein CWB95_22990, partial [Pseudoalteromonas piscicida]